MKYRLCAAVLLLVSVCSIASAERPYITIETIIKNADVLFEATVVEQTQVDSPSVDYSLSDNKKALQLKFKDVRSWKPKPFSKEISVYSRLPSEAPCTGITVNNSKRYVVFGHYDSTKKLILADWCIDIHEATAESGKDIRARANALLGEPT